MYEIGGLYNTVVDVISRKFEPIEAFISQNIYTTHHPIMTN